MRMGTPIPEQLAMFLGAILLGGCLGLVYDLFRAVRKVTVIRTGRRKRIAGLGRVFNALLDAVYCVTAVSSVFFFVMAGEGELQVFTLLGVLGGAVLFFCLLSPLLRPLWDFWLGILLLPVGVGWKIFRKLLQICKKLFSFFWTWFTIIPTYTLRRRADRRKAGESGGQGEKVPGDTSQQQTDGAAPRGADSRHRRAADQPEG